MSDDAEQFFTSKSTSAFFPEVGATVSGTVLSYEQTQQTDMDGKPMVWPDSNQKRMQLKVGLQTSERDPAIEDDDGIRYLYVKGSTKPESESMRAAVGEALRQAKAKLEIGGTLSVTITFKAPDRNPEKLWNRYSATYKAPDFFAEPKAAPVSDPNAGLKGVLLVRQLLDVPGLTDAQIAATAGVTAGEVAILRAQLTDSPPF